METKPARNNPMVVIEDGRIASISSRASAEPPDPLAGRGFRSPASILSAIWRPGCRNRRQRRKSLHFPGATLAPAFFDVHIHGAQSHDVMEATC